MFLCFLPFDSQKSKVEKNNFLFHLKIKTCCKTLRIVGQSSWTFVFIEWKSNWRTCSVYWFVWGTLSWCNITMRNLVENCVQISMHHLLALFNVFMLSSLSPLPHWLICNALYSRDIHLKAIDHTKFFKHLWKIFFISNDGSTYKAWRLIMLKYCIFWFFQIIQNKVSKVLLLSFTQQTSSYV